MIEATVYFASQCELGIEATFWRDEPAVLAALIAPAVETDPVEAWAWV